MYVHIHICIKKDINYFKMLTVVILRWCYREELIFFFIHVKIFYSKHALFLQPGNLKIETQEGLSGYTANVISNILFTPCKVPGKVNKIQALPAKNLHKPRVGVSPQSMDCRGEEKCTCSLNYMQSCPFAHALGGRPHGCREQQCSLVGLVVKGWSWSQTTWV